MILKFDRQLSLSRKGGVAIKQLARCCLNLCKARAGLLFGAALFIMVSSACNHECYEDDSRNERKFIHLESPSFPGITDVPVCPVLENPAELLFVANNDVNAVFECPEIRNDVITFADKWVLALEVNGQCANQERYIEEFGPDLNSFNNCGSTEMEVNSLLVGDDFHLAMCLDPHVPNNYGSADYTFSLYYRSSSFGNTENCSCENHPLGYIDEAYVVRGKAELILEGINLHSIFDDDAGICSRIPLVFPPFLLNTIDCI